MNEHPPHRTGRKSNNFAGSNGAAGIPAVIAVPKELAPGEHRVATVPEVVQKLTKSGHEVRIEHDAGTKAFYPDDLYLAAGAKIASSRKTC